MPSEVARIRQLPERTYEGDAWPGPSVQAVLAGLLASQALKRVGDNHIVLTITMSYFMGSYDTIRIMLGRLGC